MNCRSSEEAHYLLVGFVVFVAADDGTVKDVNVVTTLTATSGTIGFLNRVEDRRLWR